MDQNTQIKKPPARTRSAEMVYGIGAVLGFVLGLIGGLSVGGGAVLVFPVLATIAGVAAAAAVYRMLADTWPVLLFFVGFFAFISILWIVGEALF